MKILFIVKIVILSLFVSSASIMGEPVVEDVTIDPLEPKALDTVTITAEITSDEDIDEVTLRIKECDESMCMPTESYQMDLDDGKYTITDDLTYSGATYFSYQLVIISNENVTYWPIVDDDKEFRNVTLKPADKGKTNGGNGEGNNEILIYISILILIVLLIGVVVFAITRKKDKK